MYKKNATLLLLAVSLLVGNSAAAANNLFKSYAYGSPRAAYTEDKGYYDCSAEVGQDSLCMDDVDFVGKKFTAALIFSSSKLSTVSLMAEYDQDLYIDTIAALSKTFTLVSLADANSQLDIADAVTQSKTSEDLAAKVTNYESVALNAGNLTYTFLEGTLSFVGKKNAMSMVASVPDNARAAELVLTGQGPETAVVIRFTMPKLDANKLVEAKSKAVEAF